jgi:glycosyltransferase involved in cell wall biosynthesis
MTKPLNILIATTAFPRWEGDTRAPFILEAAKAIHRLGHSVRVIAMHNPGAKTYEHFGDIEVIRPKYLPDRWEILQKNDGGLPVMWASSPLTRLIIFPFLLRQALAIAKNSKNMDIIHANWILSGFIAWVTKAYHKRNILITVHGSDLLLGTKPKLFRLLNKLALDKASAVICVSQYLAQVTRELGVNPSKIHVIPDGVDTSQFYSGGKPPQPDLLYVGALTEKKGVQFLIQALPRVSKYFKEGRLVIAGDGPFKTHLVRLVDSLQINHQVKFVGNQPQNQIRSLMQQSKMVILPSLSEGLGVVLLEALATGTPCVGTKVGGIPDIITPEVGFLVDPGDPQALSEAILAILNLNGTDYSNLCLQARERAVNRFDWDKVANRINTVYESVYSKQK